MRDNPNYYSIERSYKSKYICIECRKSFKRKILADFATSKDIEEKEATCPLCGQPTNWIGPKFRAPKSDNIKAWNSIKILQHIGLLQFMGWASIHVEISETKKSLNDLLKDLKNRYELSIQRWATSDYSPENKNQIKHLAEVVKKIDQHLRIKK